MKACNGQVENSLEREVENIKTYQQRMQKMLAKVRGGSIYQSFDLSIKLSVCLTICMSVYLSIYLSIYL